MENNNILYVPIQINGGGTKKPSDLLERELYVLDGGTLYVGVKDGNTVRITEVAGRVIPGATITDPIISGTLRLAGNNLVVTKEKFKNMDLKTGQVVFVDDGPYDPTN